MFINLKNRFFQSGAVVVVTLMGAQIACAQSGIKVIGDNEIFENFGTITNSGGSAAAFTMGSNNKVPNAKGGKIEGVLPGVKAAISGKDGNVVDNEGVIETKADGSIAIDVHNNNTITNSGTITTSNDSSKAIVAYHANKITNSALIQTLGKDSDAIQIDHKNTVVNTGSIITSGQNSNAMRIGNKNTIINTGSIITSGQSSNAMRIDNENTIINTGSIITSGQSSSAIRAENKNKITNYDLLKTSGFRSFGIAVGDNNDIVNRGKIITEGGEGYGIISYLPASNAIGNRITNYGEIRTKGHDANGIIIAGDSGPSASKVINFGSIITEDGNGIRNSGVTGLGVTIINNGMISVSGAYNQNAIYQKQGGVVVNNGSLRAMGKLGDGIEIQFFPGGGKASDGATVTNNGSIETSGKDGDGIYVDLQISNNKIINTGSIHVTGESSEGINVGSGNTVTNSGWIVAEQGSAIDFEGSDNTLTLQGVSFIGGKIKLGRNAKLKLKTRRSHSRLWEFEGKLANGQPETSGPVPYLYNAKTKQFATYDPTPLSADVDALAETAGLISRLTRNRLANNRLKAGDYLAYGSEEKNTQVMVKEATMKKRFDPKVYYKGGERETYREAAVVIPESKLFGRSAWIAALGGKSKYESTDILNKYDASGFGFAVGYDWTPKESLKMGILGGYVKSEAKDADSRIFKNEATGFFAGIYARKQLNKAFFDSSLTGGVSEHKTRRMVNDNLVNVNANGGSLGEAHATGEYNGFWLAPEIAISADYDLGKDWISTPSARLRYISQWAEDYSEKGLRTGVKIDSRRVVVGEASVEWAARKTTEKGSFTGRVGYLYRASLGEDAKVSLISQTVNVPDFYKNRNIGHVGADVSFKLMDKLDLDIGGQARFAKDYKGFDGTIALITRF